jgi:MoxR-like ATPase
MAVRTTSRQDREFVERLVSAMKASQGLVWLSTMEESRALRLIASAARSTGKNMQMWSCTEGMRDLDGKVVDGTVPSINALNSVLRGTDPCAYAFLDLTEQMIVHPGTQGMFVLRRLKDVATRLYTSPSTVFVVTSKPTPPPELGDLALKMDVPLPDNETIKAEVLQEMARRGLLNLSTGEVNAFAEALLGATLQQAEDILAWEITKHGKLTTDLLSAVREARAKLVETVVGLQFIELSDGLADVGGISAFRKWFDLRRAGFTDEGREAGLEVLRGVLFVGPPGVGKSLLAKTIARLLGLILLRLDMGALFNKYVGESEANLRRLQSVVDRFPGAVLWVDEIEKVMPAASGDMDGGTSSRVLGGLLTWGQERKGKVVVVATANDVQSLRPEILRTGRFFDAIFSIDLPIYEDRKDIFATHLRMRKKHVEQIDLDALAKASRGYTGAEIEEAVKSSLYIAFSAKQELATEHLLDALKEVRPISQTMPQVIERIRKWGRVHARPAGPEDKDVDDE